MDGRTRFQMGLPPRNVGRCNARRSLGFLISMLALGVWLAPPREAQAEVVVNATTTLWTPPDLATAASLDDFTREQSGLLFTTLWGIDPDPDTDLLLLDVTMESMSGLHLERDGEVIASASLTSLTWRLLVEQSEQMADSSAGVISKASLRQWLVAGTAQTALAGGDEDFFAVQSIPILGLVLSTTLARSDGGHHELHALTPLAVGEDAQTYVMAAKQIGSWTDAVLNDGPVEIDCIVSGGGKDDAIDCLCGCISNLAAALLQCAGTLTLALLACGLIFLIGMVVIIAACPAAGPVLFARCIAGPARLNLRFLTFCSATALSAFLLCIGKASWDAKECARNCP